MNRSAAPGAARDTVIAVGIKHLVGGNDGEKGIGKAADGLHLDDAKVHQRHGERLDFVHQGIGVPVRVRKDVAADPIGVLPTFNVIAHKVRRGELPGVLGRYAWSGGGVVVRGVQMDERAVAQARPGFPGRAQPPRRRAHALGVLNDPVGIELEEVTAAQHVEDSRRGVGSPWKGPRRPHRHGHRRQARIHAVQDHGIGEVGPLEIRMCVVDEQRGHSGCQCARGVERIVIATEPGQLDAGTAERLIGRHAFALVVGVAPSSHRRHGGHEVGFTTAAARGHGRVDAVVEHVDEALYEFLARCFVGHDVGVDGKHRPEHVLAKNFGLEAAGTTATSEAALDDFLHFRRHRIAGERFDLALLPGAAVKAINRHALGLGLEHQAVGRGRPLERFGCDFNPGAAAGDADQLLDCQAVTVEDDGFAGLGRGDSVELGVRSAGERQRRNYHQNRSEYFGPHTAGEGGAGSSLG